ncbi:NACHT domain-containing protein [Miniphocaeibacter sp.]
MLETVTDKQLVGTMTRIIDPNCKYIEKGSDTPVSRLLSCEGNFPPVVTSGGSGAYKKVGDNLSAVATLALRMKTEDIIKDFNNFVLTLIDEDKKAIIVLALLDIIKKDLTINEVNKLKFEKYIGTTKEDLFSQGEFVLSKLLAGIFLYTVVSVKNTVGKVCVKTIDPNYLNAFESKRESINVVDYNEIIRAAPSLDILSLEDQLYFDDDFDDQVIRLDRVLRWVDGFIMGRIEKQMDDIGTLFVETLNNTVSQGRLIKNTAGSLKDFIDKLAKSAKMWKDAERDEDGDSEDINEILFGIKTNMDEYLDFRQDYLLNRKVALSPDLTPSEKMILIFKQAIMDYRIIDFVNNDPSISLSMNLEMDAEYFSDVVRNRITLPFAHDQKEKTFIKINEFIQTINKYNTYLSHNMYPINNKKISMYIPMHSQSELDLRLKFEESTGAFRMQLDEIYGQITNGETLFIYSINDTFGGSNFPLSNYLIKLREKYSMIKTLLYSDQPRSFYDFYVCNSIERRIPKPGRHGVSYETEIIENITFISLLEYSRFIILSGTGGLGKSMMMRHLLLDSIECYKETEVIPVFIPLKDYDETTGSLFDYAYTKMESLGGNITESQFGNTLEKGLCLLLFDGLDEIGTVHAKRFELELEKFTDKYPENYFVLSSRPYQDFVSYSRFTVLRLRPFSKLQAMQLIEKLEFRLDEPIIKKKFYHELEHQLYRTHREFTENPLLLTIMLMTFEQFAEIPSKMHIFYREAFLALSQKHDASKGAYKRTLRTGLSTDRFADYFAELCSRSYHDEKFELDETEFAKYYNELKEREKEQDRITNAEDFLYDLCTNMCLMYFEGGKYHFTHRSFQEYFCALYFSKQKDKNLKEIGNFFENRRTRTYGDKTFSMLYDMISAKVEEYIFLPLLDDLYKKCDKEDGYWTFLETLYLYLSYEKGETNVSISNDPQSYLYEFISLLNDNESVDYLDLPHYEQLVVEEYVYLVTEDGREELVNSTDVSWEYEKEYGEPDTVGWLFEIDIDDILRKPEEYKELLEILDKDDFVLKVEYIKMRKYLEELKAKQKVTGGSLFDLF